MMPKAYDEKNCTPKYAYSGITAYYIIFLPYKSRVFALNGKLFINFVILGKKTV